ncbi:hypothetical protein ACFQ3W_13615 [Paenibacillus puldeungensis]|uniref:Lipoprotein n=1 Tax=Paenibacillus puldeungensis TaxID=696536 RepID=A0ABW3RYL5_9BACL
MPHSGIKTMLTLMLAGLLIVSSLTGCTKKEQPPSTSSPGQTSSGQNSTKPETNDDSQAAPEKDASSNARNKVLQEFESLRAKKAETREWIAFFDQHLTSLPQEDADQLMQKLLTFYEEDLPKVQEQFAEETVAKALSALEWPITEKGLEQIQDNAVKTKIKAVLAGGYKLETAEGMVFPVVDYGALKKYNASLSEKMQQYIGLLALESDKKMASDGGLVISWDELAKRTIAFEKFFKAYPGTPEANRAKELYYSSYLSAYLYGLDNTPIFDFDTFKLTDEAKASYEKTVKAYPDTTTAEVVQGFLDVLKKTKWQVFRKADGQQTDIPEVKEYRDRVFAGHK